mgnify:FL=1
MAVVLIIIAILLFIISVSLHKSADKIENRYNNRPSIITSPSSDLFTNQKYAIINILAFTQGTNSANVYSDEANSILNKWLSKLGLSQAEAEKSISFSMSLSPEESIQSIRDSLTEIRDKAFIRSVYRDADRIARISNDKETIEFITEFFNIILSH